MEITSFPKGINKIIIDYCHYPKLYSKELKYKLRLIYYFIKLEDVTDFGYTNFHIVKQPKDGWMISSIMMNDIRSDLSKRKRDRDIIFGIKRNPPLIYQRGHYLW